MKNYCISALAALSLVASIPVKTGDHSRGTHDSKDIVRDVTMAPWYILASLLERKPQTLSDKAEYVAGLAAGIAFVTGGSYVIYDGLKRDTVIDQQSVLLRTSKWARAAKIASGIGSLLTGVIFCGWNISGLRS